jgi:HPt (histidine-containing phosphotransfer) domain-containing protein
MHAALQKGDLAQVGRLGHRLKGTCTYLSAEPAMQAALRVEHFAYHSGTQAEAEQAIKALVRECEALGTALSAYRG